MGAHDHHQDENISDMGQRSLDDTNMLRQVRATGRAGPDNKRPFGTEGMIGRCPARTLDSWIVPLTLPVARRSAGHLPRDDSS